MDPRFEYYLNQAIYCRTMADGALMKSTELKAQWLELAERWLLMNPEFKSAGANVHRGDFGIGIARAHNHTVRR